MRTSDWSSDVCASDLCVAGTVFLQVVLGVGELLVVRLHLLVDELVRFAAFPLLGGQGFPDEQRTHGLGDFIGAFGVDVAIGDLDDVRARAGDESAAPDLLTQAVLDRKSTRRKS